MTEAELQTWVILWQRQKWYLREPNSSDLPENIIWTPTEEPY